LPGPATGPERIERELDPEARGRLQTWLARLLPGSDLAYVEGATCMYTLTPDLDFIIGMHPRHPNVFIGAGFSGHGFKFSPVAGQMLSDLALHGRTGWPLERFRPDRFSPG
jgi:sarcosine oxidase